MINEIIVQEAKKWIGVKEIGKNESFDDAVFLEMLRTVGWRVSYAWCMFFVMMVWQNAYVAAGDSTIVNKLRKLFSGSVMQTYNNFKEDGSWIISKEPVPGSIMIMQKYKKGKPTIWGHTGIYTKQIIDKTVDTIEGNTNVKGSRDGDTVAYKRRELNFDSKNGLVIVGFIHPKEI